MKNGKLKKLITLATVVASTFALVACGSSSSDDSKGSDSSAKKDSGTVYRTLDEIKKDGTINIGVFSDKNPFGYVDENGEYPILIFCVLPAIRDFWDRRGPVECT